ncbi:hypothetical protein OPT61_g8102 [Boeremia exigua]|uniref:Uncharacterized protein n=1 Tax=Boeremia exigua TaxID=749465 RepID=A0ACC2HZM3_9PLEO|nr:hypothetical protein OPT61_g8102 [Boeremia exigua]
MLPAPRMTNPQRIRGKQQRQPQPRSLHRIPSGSGALSAELIASNVQSAVDLAEQDAGGKTGSYAVACNKIGRGARRVVSASHCGPD